MSMVRVRAIGVLAGGICTAACALAGGASAATIHVTPGAGDGVAADSTCTLREAINSANDNSVTNAQGCDAAGDGTSTTDVIVVPPGDYQLDPGGPADD